MACIDNDLRTILQRQQYVCLQLQFRSPLVEAIGKEQIVPPQPSY